MTPLSPHARGCDHTERHLDADSIEMLALQSAGLVGTSLVETSLVATGGDESVDAGDDAEATAHLASCDHCQQALQARVDALQLERAEIEALVDTHFDDTALDAQRRTILERLAARRDGGRVLDFPARATRPARRDRPAVRWLAAAAAAGLFVGMLAGQRLPVLSSALFGPGHESGVSRFVSRPPAWGDSTGWREKKSVATADPVLVHTHDELFLSEMETTVNNRGAAPLRALDDLTPEPVVASVAVTTPR